MNGGIKIDTNKKEMALYEIDLKIAEVLKNNTYKTYPELRDELVMLKQEKMQIYKNDEQVINRVLNQYIKDVKKQLEGS